jgi:cyclophilin family peptidyl-prolyl cis-trans isomerase
MMKRNWAAMLVMAALFLSACGAQPANLPTVTPLQPTQVSATSAPSNAATPTSSQVNTSSQQSSTDRPMAKLSPAERSKIGTAAPPMTIDVTQKYLATIHTAKGDIQVELDPSAAPKTVNNFVYLATNGFYDGLTFHRVEPNFVIQGGDPLGNGSGGPGYNLSPEIKLTHVDGAIAMARQSGPADSTPSSGSQFYITIGAQPNLDQQYTVFGKTVQGLDIVRKIAVGDVIQRIDITSETGASVTPAPVVAAQPVTCQPMILNVQKDDHVLGKANAPLTIVEYGDMQCPACSQLDPALKTIMSDVSDTVQLVFRHFPLTTIHDKSQITAQALEATSIQNKFWEMHDLLYEKQSDWTTSTVTSVVPILTNYAKGLGLDTGKFETDLTSQAVIDRVARDVKDAESLQLNATPSIFINGQASQPDAFLQTGVAQQLRAYALQRQQVISGTTGTELNVAKPDQVAESGALYQMTIKTTKGDIQVEIDPKLAPINANSTLFLTQKKYFDNSPVELNDTQLGAVLFGAASRSGNPGYSCGIETPAANSFSKAGVVALLSSGLWNTTEMVLTYSPTQQFEAQFTVIGHVTSGLDVVKSLHASDGTKSGDKIITAAVSKK